LGESSACQKLDEPAGELNFLLVLTNSVTPPFFFASLFNSTKLPRLLALPRGSFIWRHKIALSRSHEKPYTFIPVFILAWRGVNRPINFLSTETADQTFSKQIFTEEKKFSGLHNFTLCENAN